MENIKNILSTKLSFWDNLTIAQQTTLLQSSHMVSYQKNQLLHAGDSECLGVMLICSGDLRVYLLSEEGKEFTLYRLSSGSTCIMSASCILKNINFDVYISAETACTAVLISAITFEKIQQENIYAENFALKLASEKFSNVIWTFEQLLFYKLDKRLAIFLMDEYLKLGDKTINLTHEQVAKYIGSAREVVSRALKSFEKINILTLKSSQITLIDIDKLKEMTL